MSSWKGEEELKGALSSLATAKGVSANRIKGATVACMKWSKEYKRVVHAVENVMWKADVEHRLAYMYLIDALIRASQTKFGDDKDHFAKRFGLHMHHTLSACRKVPDDHKSNVKKVVVEWKKRGVYTAQEIEEAGGADFLGDGPLDSGDRPPPSKEKISSLLDSLQKLKQQHQQDAPPATDRDQPPRKESPPRHQYDIMSASAYQQRPSPSQPKPRYADPSSASSQSSSRFEAAPNRYPDDMPTPSSRFDQPSTSRFNQPPPPNSRFDQPPQQGTSRFDQPTQQANSRFDQPPQQGSSRFDQPPQQSSSRFDQNQANSRFDQPQGVNSRRFDQPPSNTRFDAPPNPSFARFDQPPSGPFNALPPKHQEFGYPPPRSDGSLLGRNPPGQETLKRARSRSRSRSPNKRRGPCRDFQMGRCSRGNQCRFAHDGDVPSNHGPPPPMASILPSPQSTMPPPFLGKPPQLKTRLCNTFPNCRFGDRCNFAHGERELGTIGGGSTDGFLNKSLPPQFLRQPSPSPFLQGHHPPHPMHMMMMAGMPMMNPINNTIPSTCTPMAPPHHTPMAHHTPTEPNQPPRQRRSRWEDKKPSAPTTSSHQDQAKRHDDPPQRKLDVDDEPAEDTAPAPEFTLEYDDDN
ncbi:hypothetical protein H257_18140 [Aphanomyces astaci]|uniref:C3H1-type domain-containing protein n=3 Tax=Aphanomyces astaci TaxID=112090 RepID=W4FDW6_APHAT|nr:hypothetical protein H257_18140 [Aphanomyces astaci]ETV65054.1 hypothetical protein H257_18140 [Aphanomyces astaci]|eukprot:XP_009845453.1 hypothetical protein H257_18140 [Aphanomyces astaci]